MGITFWSQSAAPYSAAAIRRPGALPTGGREMPRPGPKSRRTAPEI